MTTEGTRELTEYERRVANALLDSKFPGSEVFRKQFDHATARLMATDDNYGSIVITTKSLEPANVERRVPVTALTRDESGGPVEILLHIVNGFIHELEFVRLDGKPMVGFPRLDILKVHIETEAISNGTRQVPPAE
jgi:hypothetical protein